MRILLIDDMRTLPATVICRTAQDGIKALQYIGPFDLLLLDNDMGFTSWEGYKVIDWLEQHTDFLPD